jgi:hypothetical protein
VLLSPECSCSPGPRPRLDGRRAANVAPKEEGASPSGAGATQPLVFPPPSFSQRCAGWGRISDRRARSSCCLHVHAVLFVARAIDLLILRLCTCASFVLPAQHPAAHAHAHVTCILARRCVPTESAQVQLDQTQMAFCE